MKKSTQKISIDDLAMMVKNGFDAIENKFDNRFKILADGLEIVKSDLADVKGSVQFLVTQSTNHDKEIDTLKFRIDRIERKVGIETK